MASCSTSSIQKSFTYDLFLSFRGEVTRKNFVDYLYDALQHQGIYAFKDDERLKKGKRISDELISSIEDSRFFIIVFSKNYVSSSWCLEELVKIMECQRTKEQTAYPVFYDVEPTEVRKQNGAVGKAFAKYEKEEVAGKWSTALTEAANLGGWKLKSTADGHEAKLIKKIVEEILLELRSINYNVDEKLVGMESRIKDIESILEIDSNETRMIGIKGIGGGGKTTLARAIFDQISIQFDGKSFVENDREVSKVYASSLKSLQRQVLADVFNDHGIIINSLHDGKKIMKMRLRHKKVLVVLDDVDHIDQLEALAGGPSWFKPGSRIIITTRDEQVLISHQVNLIRDVNLLADAEAILLFCRYAFGKEIPIQGYEELSKQVVCYAAGLPLTIRVLGSFLCGKKELEWKDALERLKKIPLKETLEKLEFSYISLEDDYKEIFLDVTCLLKGSPKDKAIKILESRGFHAINGLRVLEQKSLITINEFELLGMHDHIEEMGKNIVRRKHPNKPNKHSRLWICEEIEYLLANNLGTKATRCIKVDMLRLSLETVMKGLGSMKKLQVLDVTFGNAGCGDWKFDEVSQYFPKALQYLGLKGYPLQSLPETFDLNNLVSLEMHYSNIIQLWERGDGKVLNNLKYLDLSFSKLKKVDIGLTPNIEVLIPMECHDLEELHMPINFGCPKLAYFKLRGSMLSSIDLALAPNLQQLHFEECDELVELYMPAQCPKLTSVHLNHAKLKTLNLGLTPKLEKLTLIGFDDMVEFHMPFGCLELTSLRIHLVKLKTLVLGLTPKLTELNLLNCHDLAKLHMPINGCPKLIYFELVGTKLSTLDLTPTPNLKRLYLEACNELVELHMPTGCPELTSLCLNHLKLKNLDLGLTPNLIELTLTDCNDLVDLHMPIGYLELTSMYLSHSKVKTLDLGLTHKLEKFDSYRL